MEFNLFKLKKPYEAKRVFFYKSDIEPYLFSKNLSRANNLRFKYSKDAVWTEVPNDFDDFKPKAVKDYIENEIEKIVAEEEPQTFVGILYSFIRKLFLDNGYIPKGRDSFFSFDNSIKMEGITNIACYVGYRVKIDKIGEDYYLSISPNFIFLSKENALKSDIKGSYVLNTKSGRSFPYIASVNGVLTIEVPGNRQKETEYGENYYFNFSSEESERLGFSKEIHRIYKEHFMDEMKKIRNQLVFLNEIAELDKNYTVNWEDKIPGNVKYIFSKGESYSIKDIFKYSSYEKSKEVKILFFFNSMEQFQKNSSVMKKLFSSKNSVFYNSLKQLGVEKIGFVKNPKTDKAIFLYNPETQQINSEDREYIENLDSDTNYIGIIILDEFLGDIEPMIKSFPRNVIMQPILRENLIGMKAYIIKSYAFKLVNFMPGTILYKIKEMEKYGNSLFIGLDISHNFIERVSSFAISAVTNTGQILYVKKYNHLELNEKMNIDILEKEFVESFNRYKELRGKCPENLYIYRDGKFLEEMENLKNISKIEDTPFALIEVTKNSNINSFIETKDNMVALSEDKFVYFPMTFFHQKGVEIEIIYNETEIDTKEIGKQGFYLTKLYYGSPYTGIKLPYPIHIADKIALSDFEWRLYIPYLK